MKQTEFFNIAYLITGKEDGRWTVEAFDRSHKPLGTKITVNTATEAFDVFMMLNGLGSLETTQIIEEMKKAV